MTKNEIIDMCIEVVTKSIQPACSDHTPYRGACCSCGSVYNPDVLPDPDTLIELLNNLKDEDDKN